jgi:putative DNA primase/helicase
MTTTRPPITIPAALDPLTKEQRWVGWRWIKGKDGKLTKPPFRADAPHLYASSTDPNTWSPLEVAMSAYCRGEVDGIGFALSGSDYSALDLDDSRIAASGVLVPWAAEQIRLSGSYAEVTPSDEGTRVIGRASGAPLHKKYSVPGNGALSCELYRRADRYITITGRQIGSATELANIDAQIDALHAELDGAKRANGAKQGAKQGKGGKSGKSWKQRDLDALIKDGCGEDFGGDRSRATWYVIHALLKQGRSPNDIVGILIDPANGISAHCRDQSRPEEYARKQVEKAQQESAGTDDTDAEIERLAKLSTVQYERERKQAAERLNVRASILDRLVQAERERLGLVEDDGRQGRSISLPEPEPWPTPVDGAALLDGIAEAIGRYVIMPEHARHAAALWVAHTYLLDCFSITPRLAVRSPMKRCGKTTLLDVISRLVLRPLPTGSVTAAALFRVVECYRPTLLVDEADTFLAEADELRGVLNSGHRKGGQVVRTVGDDHEPRAFSTFAAVAIAIIGNLPDTLADRSITVDLKRRMPSEAVASFRFDRVAHLDVLARQAARWAQDHAGTIAAADPEMPGIHNREADNWAPLFAIADVAGGEWRGRARAAALSAHAAAGGDEASLIEILLGDIRDIFAKREENKVEPVDRIPSSDLVEALVAIEGRPWPELGRNRKPLTQNGLARRLKPLAIAPDSVRVDEKRTPKGYYLHQFKDAFARYLGVEGGSEPQQRNNADETGTSEGFKSATAEPVVAVGKCEKSANDGPCCGVADEKGDVGGSVHTDGGNGLAPGLSQRTITELADDYTEAAYRQNREGSDIDSATLDTDLRLRLAEMVLPEFVEVEFERIMARVFRV